MIDFSIACIVAGLFFISIGCFLLNREIQKNLSEQARLGDLVPRNFANHVSNIADVRKGLRALESYNCNFEKMVNQRLEAVESVADRTAALEKKAEEMGDDIFFN